MGNKFDIHILVVFYTGAGSVNFLKANTKEPYVGDDHQYLFEKIKELLKPFEFEQVDGRFCEAFRHNVHEFCIDHEITNYHDTILETKTR